MAVSVGTVFVNVVARTEAFKAQMAGMQTSLVASGATLNRVGGLLTKTFTIPLGLAGGAAVKLALDYNAAFTKIAAITNASQKQIATWRSEILRLSKETAQAPEALANSLYFVASAGLDAADVMPVVENSARAAAVGMGEADVVGRLLINTLNAYEKSGITAAEATSTLVAAVREGTAEPNEFAHAMGRILPIASKAKVEFDEIAASLSQLSNIGLDVNEGVTAMRGLLKALFVPASDAADAIKEIGLSVDQVRNSLAQEGILATLRMLEAAAKETAKTPGEVIELMSRIIPNIRALTGAFGLTIQEADELDAAFKRIVQSGGSMREAFKTTQKDPMFQLQQGLAELRVVGIKLGNDLIPVVLKIADIIVDLAKGFTQLSDGTQEWLLKLGGLLIIAGPMLRFLGGMKILLGGLLFSARVLAGLFAGISSGLLGIGTAATKAGKGVVLYNGAIKDPVTGKFAKNVAASAGAMTTLKGIAGGLLKGIAGLGAKFILAGSAIAIFNAATENRSLEDLVESTHLAASNLDLIHDKFSGGPGGTAGVFNFFSTEEDKMAEAGEIAARVVEDLVKQGYSMAAAFAMVNDVFEESAVDIGGLTGSMDTLEQNLRSRLGVPVFEEEVKLLNRRLDEAVDNMDLVFTKAEGSEGILTARGMEVQMFRAALISLKNAGIPTARFLDPVLREAVEENGVSWEHLTAVMERFKMPFSRLTEQWQRWLILADEPFEAKKELYDFLLLADQMPGIDPTKWEDLDGLMEGISTGTNQIVDVWDYISKDQGPSLEAMFGRLAGKLTSVQINTLAAKVADEDWAGALRLVHRWLGKVAEKAEERRRAKLGFPTEEMNQTKANLDELLTFTQRWGTKWGELLAEPAGILPQSLKDNIDQLVRQVDFSELTKAQKIRLQVAVESGNTADILSTIWNIIRQIKGRHKADVDADTAQADEKLSGVRRKFEDWESSEFTSTVDANTDPATAAMQNWMSLWGNRSITIDVGVTTPSELGGIRWHSGGLVKMHGGGLKSDERLSILQVGEFVMQRSAVRRLGSGTLEMLNSGAGLTSARGAPVPLRGNLRITDWRTGLAQLQAELDWEDRS